MMTLPDELRDLAAHLANTMEDRNWGGFDWEGFQRALAELVGDSPDEHERILAKWRTWPHVEQGTLRQ
jgi:hypothetical protein